ncbi:MAG: trigger factor [Candidatus Pacebacteria bacterium]|nr:trigger factor [Candidatus Paceibacterota bacterium]MDD5721909.1 trigger factor [Candidatus Paceibacterota bacterium]
MKLKINSLPESKQEIIVSLNHKDLLPFKETALKELNKDLQINGYRLGKAPLPIAENHLSPMKVSERMAALAIEKMYPEIILENNIQAIGRPNIYITKIVPSQEVVFKIEITVIPEIHLPDYQTIAKNTLKKDEDKLTVTAKEITEALSWLQNSRAVLQTVNRQARIDDIVTIDYQIKENQNTIPNGEDKNYSFILGKGNFIPGFEDNLIKMKSGDKKNFEIIVPKNWPEKQLQSKTLSIEVFLKEVKTKELPDLDDKFAQNVGKFKNIEELKKNIKDGLLIEKQQKEKEKWQAEVLEKISSETQIEVPEILVESELNIMIGELRNQLNQIQLPFEKYLEQIKKNEEELKKDLKKLAKKRVISSLVLREIASLEKIEVTEKEIQDKINDILKQIPTPEIKEKINQEDLKEFALSIMRNEKVFNFLERQQGKGK